MRKTYLRYVLHNAGYSNDKITDYLGELNFLLNRYTEMYVTNRLGTPVAVKGEKYIIKKLISDIRQGVESDEQIFAQAKSKVSQNNSPEISIVNLTVLADTIERNKEMVAALTLVSQHIEENPKQIFTYPYTEQEYVDTFFIKERFAEIVSEPMAREMQIDVKYSLDNRRKTGLHTFSLQQIAFGAHLQYPLYQRSSPTVDNMTIIWPLAIKESIRVGVQGIADELLAVKETQAKMQELRQAGKTIKEARFIGIIAYAQELIDKKVKGLNITQHFDLNSKITVMTTRTEFNHIRRIHEMKEVKKEYSVWELIFNRTNNAYHTRFENDKLGELARYLHDLDLQTMYHAKIKAWRSNDKYKSAFDFLMRANIQPLLASNTTLYRMEFFNHRLAGLLYAENKDNSVNILSLLEQTVRTFDSFENFKHKFNNDIELRQWILQHSVEPLAKNYTENIIWRQNATVLGVYQKDSLPSDLFKYGDIDTQNYSYYADYLERFYREADILATSDSELLWTNVLEMMKIVALFASLATLPLGLLAGFAIGSVLGATPALIQSMIADDPDEKNAYLFEAALSVMFEAAGVGLAVSLPVVAKGGRAIINKLKESAAYRKHFFHRLSLAAGRSIDDISVAPLADIDDANRWRKETLRKISSETPVVRTPESKAIDDLLDSDGALLSYQTSGIQDNGYRAIVRLNKLLVGGNGTNALILKSRLSSQNLLKKLVIENRLSVKYRSIDFWPYSNSETHTRHFVALITLDNVTYVANPSAAQFSKYGWSAERMQPEQAWFNACSAGVAKDAPDTLVKYKDFDTIPDAWAPGKPQVRLAPDEVVDNRVILHSPRWYKGEAVAGLGIKGCCDNPGTSSSKSALQKIPVLEIVNLDDLVKKIHFKGANPARNWVVM